MDSLSYVILIILGVLVIVAVALLMVGLFVYALFHNLWRTLCVAFSFFRAFPSAISIVGANIIPLAGVIWFEWKPFEVLLTYWIQTIIIYYFSLFKLKRVAAFSPSERSLRVVAFAVQKSRRAVPVEKLIRDFKKVCRFGMITTILFIIFLTGYLSERSFGPDLLFNSLEMFFLSVRESWAAIFLGSFAFFTHHGSSYLLNFVQKKEYVGADIAKYLRYPVERVGIIWGAMFMLIIFFFIPEFIPSSERELPATLLANSLTFIAFVVLLIFFKTIIDVYAHVKEHKAAFKQWLEKEKINLENLK